MNATRVFNRPIGGEFTAVEHDLLLAAAAACDSVRADVEQLLARDIDWTRLVQLALDHRMAPAMLVALEAADAALVPADVLTALRSHCGTLRKQNERLTSELFELLRALARRSIITVPFKGPLLGELLYGDTGLRSPGDLDLLVRAADVDAVCEVLEERGFVDNGRRPGVAPLTPTQRQMYLRFQCEYQFIRPSDGLVVEPHWGLSQRPLAIDVDYEGMLDRAVPTELEGRAVLTLAPDDLLLALCVHGSKHRWERLSWIRDVAALIVRFPDLDLHACLGHARRQGCGRLLLVGLGLAHACAGMPLSAPFQALIDEDPTALALQREAVADLFDPDRQEPRNDRIERFRFRMRERGIDRARYVARTLLMPRRHHIEMVALPSPFRWAYFPLAWGIDYAVVPIWNLLKPGSRVE